MGKLPLIVLSIALIGSNLFWLQKEKKSKLLYTSGIEKIQKKDFKGAAADFNKALTQNPDDPSAHFGVAWAYQLSGQNPESIKHYARSIALSEDLLNFSLNNLQFIEQNMTPPNRAELLGQKRNALKQLHAISIQ